MVYGIGTDLIKVSNLAVSVSEPDDPFVRKTYTSRELEIIQSRPIPLYCYATRFAGKEAVFKSLSIDSNNIRLNEIEILEHENGQPYVILHGNAASLAREKGITKILISLSYDTDYAIAYATSVVIDK